MSESFIQVAMGDAPEEGLCEEGRVDLRIISKEVKDTKAGDRKLLAVMMAVEGVPDVSPIMEHLTFPNAKDWETDEQLAKNFLRRVKRFCAAFGITWQADGFDVSQLNGATAEDILVKIEVGKDDGVERNKAIFPRIEAGQ